MENLNASRFHLYGYYVDSQTDDVTEQAAMACHSFVRGRFSVKKWAMRIRVDKLHALLIPGLSMNPMTAQLAALRLAPIQINGVGHPVTSGLPTMDYYLTSKMMEPKQNKSHYPEILVGLPNLGVH